MLMDPYRSNMAALKASRSQNRERGQELIEEGAVGNADAVASAVEEARSG